MPPITIKRSTTGSPPANLAFGEMAYADSGDRLFIGKNNGSIFELPLGAGTVSSVGLSLPSIFSVTGTPITTSGTLTATLASQTANRIFAAPNGSTGAPTFRSLVPADFSPLPSLNAWAAPTTAVAFGSQRITGVADPTQNQDAATKAYVDAMLSTGNNKGTVRSATTAALTLTGATATSITNTGGLPTTLDGVTLTAGDLILVKDQVGGTATGAIANGLYIYAAGNTWNRATNADTSAEVGSGLFVFVSEGTINGDNGFTITTNDPITLGTTSITFTQTSGAGQIDAGAGLTKTGNQINAVGTANRIVVNADNIDIGSDVVTLTGNQTLTNKTIAGSQITGNIPGNAANVTGTVGLANGGTGATTAATARTNLGLSIGTNVQAFSTRLDSLASATLSAGDFIFWNGTALAGVGVIDGGTY